MLSGFSSYPAAPNLRRLAVRGYGKSRRACRTRNCVAMLLKAEAWHSGVVPDVPASARVGGCGSDRKGDTNTNRKDLDERASFAVLPCYCSISQGADRVNDICERRIIGAGRDRRHGRDAHPTARHSSNQTAETKRFLFRPETFSTAAHGFIRDSISPPPATILTICTTVGVADGGAGLSAPPASTRAGPRSTYGYEVIAVVVQPGNGPKV